MESYRRICVHIPGHAEWYSHMFPCRHTCTCSPHWVTSIFTSRPVCDIWLFAAKGVWFIDFNHVHIHTCMFVKIM